MDLKPQLARIAARLKTDREDLRHTVLDVADDFLAVASDAGRFDGPLRDEVCEIVQELLEVQPRFKSHRKTSALFDRAGMGLPGKQRAEKLALRIIAVCEAAQRTSGG